MNSSPASTADVSESTDPRVALVLLAAGSGSRVGHRANKVLLPLAGRILLTWSLRSALQLPQVRRVVLAVAERDRAAAAAALADGTPEAGVELVVGGATRHDSEWSALSVLSSGIESGDIDIVVIHDAARPLASTQLFADVITAAQQTGGALPGRLASSIIDVDPQVVPPAGMVAVQTPQAFRALPLLRAYQAAREHGFVGTDTASCIEAFSDLRVCWVPGPATNIKITFPEDLRLAEHLLLALSPRSP